MNNIFINFIELIFRPTTFFTVMIGIALSLFSAPEIDAFIHNKGLKRWGNFYQKYMLQYTFYNNKPTLIERLILLLIILIKLSFGIGLIVIGFNIK